MALIEPLARACEFCSATYVGTHACGQLLERERWPNLSDRDREVARIAIRATQDLFPEVVDRTEALPNDRYTTRATLDWCKRVLRVTDFELDVAACWESHKAQRWYGWFPSVGEWVWADGSCSRHDGRLFPWDAARIWCNPPYDDLLSWVMKAWREVFEAQRAGRMGVIGMLIPDNRREQPFWQEFIEPFRDGRWNSNLRELLTQAYLDQPFTKQIQVALDTAQLRTHSLPGRQAFGVPGNPEGKGQQSPPFGVVLLEWRF